jgi:phosphatidylserine decarboxylase
MTIDRAGWPFIGAAWLPAAACLFTGLPLPAIGLAILGVALGLFFRDPVRHPPTEPGIVVSPADGKVLSTGQADPTLAPEGAWEQISIFLSPLDVHVNRVPHEGRVTRVDHVPGKFLPAYRDRAEAENERNEVWVEYEGQTIVFRQVVGALARRVVCRVRVGDSVQTGERFGIMKFGSRMDVFLPAGTDLLVTAGDTVRGGETIVARLT